MWVRIKDLKTGKAMPAPAVALLSIYLGRKRHVSGLRIVPHISFYWYQQQEKQMELAEKT